MMEHAMLYRSFDEPLWAEVIDISDYAIVTCGLRLAIGESCLLMVHIDGEPATLYAVCRHWVAIDDDDRPMAYRMILKTYPVHND